MLENLSLGLAVMVVCLLMQSLLLVAAIRYCSRRERRLSSGSLWSGVLVVNGVMLILVLGNLGQLTLWALLFVLLGEFDGLSTAVYHSAVNFATLGYGDIVMSEERRLLGALEAVNGVLMFGLSTAALSWALQDALRRFREARQGKADP